MTTTRLELKGVIEQQNDYAARRSSNEKKHSPRVERVKLEEKSIKEEEKQPKLNAEEIISPRANTPRKDSLSKIRVKIFEKEKSNSEKVTTEKSSEAQSITSPRI